MEWIKRDFSKDRTIFDGLREHSGSEKTAVVCGEQSVSYQELILKSKQLAQGLLLSGAGKGDYVVLAMSRSTDFVCGLLGILFAGAAYVAVDREWPKERLDFIRQDCAAAVVLDDDLFEKLIKSDAQTKLLGIGERDAQTKLPEIEESDAFAVYYTSGSTGNPKGTLTHHAVFLHESMPLPGNICSYETVRTCKVVFSMGNFAYAAIACDIIFCLYNGLTLVLATDQERLSPAQLGECMKKHHADALLVTPSALLAHLEDPAFSEGFAGLKRVIFTGEGLSERDANKIASYTNATLFNGFGSSEVSFVSYARIVPGKPIGLGTATDGAELLVLDENGKAAREGELCIGGIPGRYGCYLGPSSLTASKFTLHEKYGRIYHTGDLAVVEEGGQVRLTGRKDGMQKLHGQRLEPGEIEKTLERFEGVRQAAVGIRGEGKRAVLCAWYTSDHEIDEVALVEFLSACLPSYMVPTFFKRLKTMPLNSNEKLDRSSLPDIHSVRTGYQAPDTAQQRQMCEAFEQVLGCVPVGVEDHFFTIGGDSICGMQLLSLLSDKYGIKLSLRDLVIHPTPKLLAQFLQACQKAAEEEEKEEAKDKDFKEESAEPDVWTLPKNLRTVAKDPGTEAVLPISGAAMAFLFMKFSGVRNRFNITRSQAELSCAFTEEEFLHRVSVLVQNHPALRSSFVAGEDGKYWQIIHKSREVPLWYKDLSGLSDEGAQRFIHGFWQVMEDESLFSAAFFVLGESRSVLLLRTDHTVVDGMSIHVIANELAEEGYANRKTDGYISHRRRILRSGSELTPALRSYFDKAKNIMPSVNPLISGNTSLKSERIVLSLSETDALIKACARLEVLPYSFLTYAYGQAILAVTGCEEVWFQDLNSGRYADWEDELRIVGNLIFAAPVRVSKTMTPQEFQEDLFRIRDCHILSDSPLFLDKKWNGLMEGIVSDNFVKLAKPIERFEILGQETRQGNNVTMEGGCLSIKFQHMDKSEINEWYERVTAELNSRLLSVGDEEGGPV